MPICDAKKPICDAKKIKNEILLLFQQGRKQETCSINKSNKK